MAYFYAMTRSHLLFLGLLFFQACQSSATPEPDQKEMHTNPAPADSSTVDTLLLGVRLNPTGTYEKTKAHIRQQVSQGKHSGKDFENYLLNEIIPFWYGTPWDFNGYSAVPNQGEIACGYFVSTTLLHAGLNINRYHLAQQAGLLEARSLAITEDHYETIYGIDALDKAIRSRYRDGVYFVGLDNHVGYLLIRGGDYYFIHSNYIENRVMIEKARTAPAFQSTIYVVAELSTNDELLKKWRSGEVVKVHRP